MIAIAFEDQQPGDDTLRILLQGQFHGLLQGELDYSRRTCRSLLSEGCERKRRMQKCQEQDARSPEIRSHRDLRIEEWPEKGHYKGNQRSQAGLRAAATAVSDPIVAVGKASVEGCKC